jgi:glutamate synthase (NADPH/NADH)
LSSIEEKKKFTYPNLTLQILRDAQTLAERMYHRGAVACDNDTGDGAGVMTAIPHKLYSKEL